MSDQQHGAEAALSPNTLPIPYQLYDACQGARDCIELMLNHIDPVWGMQFDGEPPALKQLYAVLNAASHLDPTIRPTEGLRQAAIAIARHHYRHDPVEIHEDAWVEVVTAEDGTDDISHCWVEHRVSVDGQQVWDLIVQQDAAEDRAKDEARQQREAAIKAELLESLIELRRWIDSNPEAPARLVPSIICQAVDLAIAKAEGR